MSKIIIANWHDIEENLGGQESFFKMLSNTFDAKTISYIKAEKVLRFNPSKYVSSSNYTGYVIEKYLKQYEDLFKPDLIIKNSAIGGFIELKTPQIVVFQDPFHSIIETMLENFGPSKTEHAFACMDLQRRSAKNNITVAVSNFMKEDMGKCGIKCDKIIEEGIDIDKFKPAESKEDLRRMLGLPLDKKIGIAVTKFLPSKGWDILAKLINKFQDIYWIVIFTEKVGSKPKLKNVGVLEQVDPRLMSQYYGASDFFINPSLVESFGLSSIEAASCNLPIIVYKTGFAWDWWDERLGLRVDEWNYESFEKAVEDLSRMTRKNYEPRKAIIEKGFTLEKMKENWQNYVDEVLNKKL